MMAFRPDLACFGGRPEVVLKHVSLLKWEIYFNFVLFCVNKV